MLSPLCSAKESHNEGERWVVHVHSVFPGSSLLLGMFFFLIGYLTPKLFYVTVVFNLHFQFTLCRLCLYIQWKSQISSYSRFCTRTLFIFELLPGEAGYVPDFRNNTMLASQWKFSVMSKWAHVRKECPCAAPHQQTHLLVFRTLPQTVSSCCTMGERADEATSELHCDLK